MLQCCPPAEGLFHLCAASHEGEVSRLTALLQELTQPPAGSDDNRTSEVMLLHARPVIQFFSSP